MKRTPALVAAAAALGLLSGLGLEARASALTGEVSPHTVAMAWLTPGAPSPAGLELDGPGARVAPPARERLMKLPPMRARVSEEVVAERRARQEVGRKVFVHGHGACPRAQAEQAAHAAMDVRRS
ncbi:MAG TPA: hypothetical protein VF006_33200 [Longimicrobium sp.]